MSPSKIDIDPRVLGQLLAVQSTFSVFSVRQRMGEFVCRAVEGVPGVALCAVCMPGAERPRLGGESVPECADCDVLEGDIDHDPSHPCRLSSRVGIQVLPLRTQDRHFGFFLLRVEERQPYAPYEPFIGNLVNGLAVNIERQWLKDRLEVATVELRRHRDHLQDLVAKRTDELKTANDRLQHLNEVLRSIRGVNQIIVREGDVERLIQTVCECLIETRCYFNAWIVIAEPSGELIPRGMAGTDEAYIGTVKQLGPTNDLHCIAAALKHPGVVAVADPHATCSGCSLAQKTPVRSAMAIRLEHRGRVFGCLVVSTDPKFANDEEEHTLLMEVAEDIGLALHSSEQESVRKQAEAALKTSEERFRITAEIITDVVYEWDLKEKIVWFGDIDGILGYPPQGFPRTLDGWAATLHPEDKERVWKAVEGQLKSEGPYAVEYRIRKKDGEWRWWSARGTVLKGEHGEPYKWIGAITDITERKRAEETVRRSEERYRTLFESAAEGILIADIETKKFKYANPAICTILGYSQEELVKMGVGDIHPKDSLEHVIAEFGAQARGEKTLSSALPCLRKDGTIIHADVTATGAIIDERKCSIGFFADVTKRKQAEEKLLKSEEQFRLISENVADLIVVLDLEGRRIYNSPSYRDILGDPATLRGTDSFREIHPEDRKKIKAIFQETVRTGVGQRAEYRVVKPDGKDLYIESQGSVIRDKDGKVTNVVVVSRDVTEKKLLDQQFMRMQRMESIGTLAGGVAHDLNNVLAPIMLSIEILKKAIPDERSQKILETIETSAHRGAAIIKQILGFARGLQGEQVPIQFRHIINEITNIMKETFPKSINIKENIPKDIRTIVGDPTNLHQLMLNLCVNARDAMPNGGTIHIKAENKVIDEQYAHMNLEAKPGWYVLLSVEDTGCGISPAVLERIFEPFFTTKEVGKGTGLGLSIVHTIVKSHGGFINVYSEVGKGTICRIYLPAAKETGEIKPKIEENKEMFLGHGELIMVVDDESSIQQITKHTLEAYGYRVITASDGTEAVVHFASRKEEIALVLTDMMMPIMDGPRTIHALRKMNPAVKIIASSGLAGEGYAATDKALGINAFLVKPYNVEKLLETVHSVLHK